MPKQRTTNLVTFNQSASFQWGAAVCTEICLWHCLLDPLSLTYVNVALLCYAEIKHPDWKLLVMWLVLTNHCINEYQHHAFLKIKHYNWISVDSVLKFVLTLARSFKIYFKLLSCLQKLCIWKSVAIPNQHAFLKFSRFGIATNSWPFKNGLLTFPYNSVKLVHGEL